MFRACVWWRYTTKLTRRGANDGKRRIHALPEGGGEEGDDMKAASTVINRVARFRADDSGLSFPFPTIGPLFLPLVRRNTVYCP